MIRIVVDEVVTSNNRLSQSPFALGLFTRLTRNRLVVLGKIQLAFVAFSAARTGINAEMLAKMLVSALSTVSIGV